MLNELKDYLSENYCTLEELSINLNLSASEIMHWVKCQCIPERSYEIVETKTVNSVFGEYQLSNHSILYFNKNIIFLIEKISRLSSTYSVEQISAMQKKDFFVRYKQQLMNLGLNKYRPELLDAKENINEEKLIELIDREWQSYCKGIYGLCTNTMQPEQIVIKEAMINYIKLLTNQCTKETLSLFETNELTAAIQQLEETLPLFAPHERKGSSRYLWLEIPQAKYLGKN